MTSLELDARLAEVEVARTRVAASIRTLGEEVARRGDWRAWVRARPTLALAGALALGFLWGRRQRQAPKYP
jgi:hypothetical protein